MMRITAVSGAGIAAVALTLTLAACAGGPPRAQPDAARVEAFRAQGWAAGAALQPEPEQQRQERECEAEDGHGGASLTRKRGPRVASRPGAAPSEAAGHEQAQ